MVCSIERSHAMHTDIVSKGRVQCVDQIGLAVILPTIDRVQPPHGLVLVSCSKIVPKVVKLDLKHKYQ